MAENETKTTAEEQAKTLIKLQEQATAQALELKKLRESNKDLEASNIDLVKANSNLYSRVIASDEVFKPEGKSQKEDKATINFEDLQDKAIKIIVSKANRDKDTERKLTAEVTAELKKIEEK